MSLPGEGYQSPQYLMTSEELLAPEVGAVEVGLLQSGTFAEIRIKMEKIAEQRGIARPKLIVDLIFSEGKESEFGSKGQPYPIVEKEWEEFAKDVPAYCGDNVPKVYVVDGSKYTAPI